MKDLAKAGQTPSGDMLDGVKRVQAALGPQHSGEVIAIYAGSAEQRRGEGRLLPWDRVHEQAWA
jgi:hypothetical protein